MKNRLPVLRIILGLCAAFGWWGLIYPELALTPDTVLVRSETGENLSAEWDFDAGLYEDLLEAGRGRLVLRSRLLTDFNSFWEAFHHEDK